MRIVEKLLYGVGGLLALMLLFIALCNHNPDIAMKIGERLGKTDETADEMLEAGMSGVDTPGMPGGNYVIKTTVTQGEEPAAGNPGSDDGEEEEPLNIPQKVAALNGYIPIKSTGTEITQAKADEILETLGKGKTGEGLTFDEEFYPYYGMINETQKALYRQIYANADDMEKNFSPVTDITANDLKNAFTAVVSDHPELFWVDTAYKYKYAPLGQVADITLVFNMTANDIDGSKSKFEDGAKKILDRTYGQYTDYDKEREAHDALISSVRYDANAPMNQSAYSALVYGRTVCAGYARALQYVLQQLDIPCYYVMGYAGENHAWNIVKLEDSQYYNVDSTWDDTNPNTYDYFNCSDADYAGNHVRRDLSIYLPACRGSRYSGLEVNPVTTPTVTPTTPTRPQPTTPATVTTVTGTTTTTTNGTTSEAPVVDNTANITVQTVRGSEEGYIGDIYDYYIACFEEMMATEDSNISFDLIITDKDLWDDIFEAYDDGDVQDGFIERYLVEKHRNSCVMSVTAQEREDGSWLLSHTAEIN